MIRVISSDNLGFVKDTSKEDSEKALKDSWEIGEIGRGDKAKKARLKHLLVDKQEKGETLSLEEEKILRVVRERKTSLTQNQPHIEEPLPVKKVDPKKNVKPDPKKKDQKEIIEIPMQPVILLDMNKPCPKSESHVSAFIKEYLVYCYKDRKVIKNSQLDIDKSKKNSLNRTNNVSRNKRSNFRQNHDRFPRK